MQATLTSATPAAALLVARFRAVREATMRLIAPLSPEDCMVQSSPDASPVKWHLAHTSWFFETFVLREFAPGYQPFHPQFHWLFNSYYNALGEMPEKKLRASFSRPPLTSILEYRSYVDRAVDALLGGPVENEALRRISLGLEHEQQHQELIATDVKHALFTNPLHPAYLENVPRQLARNAPSLSWLDFSPGLTEIGLTPDSASLDTFAFDNETPRHTVYLAPFAMASRPATCAEYLAFMEEDGYRRPELWLAEGWSTMRAEGWQAPLYWNRDPSNPEAWQIYTLRGLQPLDHLLETPVCHLSLFEADAFARWKGCRLPTEFEWEFVAAQQPDLSGNFVEEGMLHPTVAADTPGPRQLFGDVWEWTQSGYTGYPGYRPLPGALGEYNGKFMSSQVVLRGGSCVTPATHIRATYRNFFGPATRWQFSGVRLAADALQPSLPAPKGPSRMPSAALAPQVNPAVVSEAVAGLTTHPKTLSPWLFYDEPGSSLFEDITRLPEYYLTRTERGILLQHAEEMLAAVGSSVTIVELGAGTATKTGILLRAAAGLQESVLYQPIDVSPSALEEACALQHEIPGVQVRPLVANYITEPIRIVRAPHTRVLALYIGSSIGNFSPEEAVGILRNLRAQLQPGDALLLGTDLAPGVSKSTETLLSAYDDAQGTTAAFNRNILHRLNRDAGTDFAVHNFLHRARWNAAASRIEMHLEAQSSQRVVLPLEDGTSLAIFFAAGETIHTENSYKFHSESIGSLLREGGFDLTETWRDPRDLFAVTLATVAQA